MAETTSPRIVFVGGSNLSYGIDSKTIKDSLCLNPINMGIPMSIGLKYMLSNAQEYIRANDIIIVSPEYQQFYGDFSDGGIELLSVVSEISPSSIKLLGFKQYYSIAQHLPKYFQFKINGLISSTTLNTTIGVYDRKAFNEYGDAFIHWNLPKVNVKPFKKIEGNFNNDVIFALKKFREMVIQRKAKLFITFPCYQDLSFKNSVPQIQEIEQNLKNSGFRILSNPERYIVPDSLTFDTPYHLTKTGVDRRTELLIEDLKRVIN